MHSRLLLALPVAALVLAGCSSGSGSTPTTKADGAGGATATAGVEDTCPTAAPASGAKADWTMNGSTGGSVSVVGPTAKTAPRVDVKTPFSVAGTRVQTLSEGKGAIIPDTATVSVCYQGVNGRDGKIFDDSYQRGEPVSFPLTGVVPGFTKAIAGQHVGSTVAVAVTSADGYPQGQPAAGIKAGDTLIFTISILSAS